MQVTRVAGRQSLWIRVTCPPEVIVVGAGGWHGSVSTRYSLLGPSEGETWARDAVAEGPNSPRPERTENAPAPIASTKSRAKAAAKAAGRAGRGIERPAITSPGRGRCG